MASPAAVGSPCSSSSHWIDSGWFWLPSGDAGCGALVTPPLPLSHQCRVGGGFQQLLCPVLLHASQWVSQSLFHVCDEFSTLIPSVSNTYSGFCFPGETLTEFPVFLDMPIFGVTLFHWKILKPASVHQRKIRVHEGASFSLK